MRDGQQLHDRVAILRDGRGGGNAPRPMFGDRDQRPLLAAIRNRSTAARSRSSIGSRPAASIQPSMRTTTSAHSAGAWIDGSGVA